MRKGENIFKRKDGRWEAGYIKDCEPSGKIKYGFCYPKCWNTTTITSERYVYCKRTNMDKLTAIGF